MAAAIEKMSDDELTQLVTGVGTALAEQEGVLERDPRDRSAADQPTITAAEAAEAVDCLAEEVFAWAIRDDSALTVVTTSGRKLRAVIG
jgi:hypothetical protein